PATVSVLLTVRRLICPVPAAPLCFLFFFFFSSRRRHTRFDCDWSSDVCSSDLGLASSTSRTPSIKASPRRPRALRRWRSRIVDDRLLAMGLLACFRRRPGLQYVEKRRTGAT